MSSLSARSTAMPRSVWLDYTFYLYFFVGGRTSSWSGARYLLVVLVELAPGLFQDIFSHNFFHVWDLICHFIKEGYFYLKHFNIPVK
jgi:hypothetical protein